MIGNVHFVAIPANSAASAGAKVVANFLLSPAAQARKRSAIWGDPSVLDARKLPPADAAQLNAHTTDGLPNMLAEPHAAWVNALEQEWLRRCGTR